MSTDREDISGPALHRLRARVKNELRDRMRAVRRVLPLQACAERSQRACSLVLELPEYARAKTIVAYVAMRKELDPSGVIAHALSVGKTVGLPRMDADTLTLHVHRKGDPLETNDYEVQEPLASAATLSAEDVDLILVPALAIDPRGYRIGYGRGFYDRVLPALHRTYKLGLAYEFQLIAEAPNAPHDVPMDCIVTDAQVRIAER